MTLESKFFDEKKGKCFPPSQTSGGIISSYCPNDFERKNCGFAPKGYDCNTIKTGPLGGKSHVISCGECLFHPANNRY